MKTALKEVTDDAAAADVVEQVEQVEQVDREYHPIISSVGGRKFALAALGMVLLTGVVVYVTVRYDPLDDRVNSLLDTYGRWLAALVGLFVSGNAAKYLPALFGREHKGARDGSK